jgi:hypothetical protein
VKKVLFSVRKNFAKVTIFWLRKFFFEEIINGFTDSIEKYLHNMRGKADKIHRGKIAGCGCSHVIKAVSPPQLEPAPRRRQAERGGEPSRDIGTGGGLSLLPGVKTLLNISY